MIYYSAFIQKQSKDFGKKKKLYSKKILSVVCIWQQPPASPPDLQSCLCAEGGSTSERTAGRKESGTVKGRVKNVPSHALEKLRERERKKKDRFVENTELCLLFLKAGRAEMPWGLVERAGFGRAGFLALSSEFMKLQVFKF